MTTTRTNNTPKPAALAAGLASTLATSLLALSSSAQAQSTVTIYGVIDATVEHVTNVGASGGSLTRLNSLAGSVPSRLGFRGTEDLGGGLKASFTIEQGLAPDSGVLNQGGRAFGRQAWVGLSGSWGALTLGRQYTMLFWSLLDADQLGPHTFGSGSIDSYLPNARADNAIAYRGTFNGVTLGAHYSLGRDAVNAGPSPSGTNCAGENGADSRACKGWSLLAKYDAANWGVAAAVDEIRGGAGAFGGLTSSALSDRRVTLNGYVKQGAWKLGGGVIARRNEGSATTPKSRLWFVGGSYQLSNTWALDGELFKLDYSGSANGATLAALRATYSFSKRTALHASVGHIDNQGTLNLSLSNGQAGANPAAGVNQSGMAVGLRHSF